MSKRVLHRAWPAVLCHDVLSETRLRQLCLEHIEVSIVIVLASLRGQEPRETDAIVHQWRLIQH
eukprot:1842328-Amphidinium_carterae.1